MTTGYRLHPLKIGLMFFYMFIVLPFYMLLVLFGEPGGQMADQINNEYLIFMDKKIGGVQLG